MTSRIRGRRATALPQACRKLNLYFPAVMVGYFDDLSEAIRRSDVDEGDLADIARRHSMEIVGPVPESYV